MGFENPSKEEAKKALENPNSDKETIKKAEEELMTPSQLMATNARNKGIRGIFNGKEMKDGAVSRIMGSLAHFEVVRGVDSEGHRNLTLRGPMESESGNIHDITVQTNHYNEIDEESRLIVDGVEMADKNKAARVGFLIYKALMHLESEKNYVEKINQEQEQFELAEKIKELLP